jgi:DNA adenine methylase
MKPFCKWAGGKQRLLPDILENIPTAFKTYFEPFLGGGAVLLKMAPNYARISDCNADLISAWEVVRDNLEGLLDAVTKHENTKEYFLKIRKADTASLTKVERASRFIYLNKTCFNGLYRVKT